MDKSWQEMKKELGFNDDSDSLSQMQKAVGFTLKETLTTVICNLCSKPIIQAQLINHLENCKKCKQQEKKKLKKPNIMNEFPKIVSSDTNTPTVLNSEDPSVPPVKKKRKYTKQQSDASEKKIKLSELSEYANQLNLKNSQVGGKTLGFGSVNKSGTTFTINAKKYNDTSMTKEKKEPKKKEKGPIDLDKNCGVETETGKCPRSITCKIHPISAKKAVVGRSHPFETLMSMRERDKQLGQAQKQIVQPVFSHNLNNFDSISAEEEALKLILSIKTFQPKPIAIFPSNGNFPSLKVWLEKKMQFDLENSLKESV
ncbi:hypothetical protein HK099_006525 [Clydaea vesicula]|uniref:SCA7 domain-containing protein n=1 Tax=Clydaea vesicula TaxID=447962 RepID=A0AAD5U609_9FUNG|nr:hypothetical protein HK099_006525 [Clydaea vesicula]